VAAELGLRDRLHLLGLRDDIETLLRAADVFVQPSRSEGLPLAVLEAMAVGLPVVASRVGGIPEAVRDGETGVLVPPSQPAALAEELRKLLESPERRLELARAGRRRVREAFSLEAMLEKYLALYAGRCPR
jgi:glycosyltransferase involved in cell wall biosynthesis